MDWALFTLLKTDEFMSCLKSMKCLRALSVSRHSQGTQHGFHEPVLFIVIGWNRRILNCLSTPSYTKINQGRIIFNFFLMSM